MTNLLERPDCARCGHACVTHYNVRNLNLSYGSRAKRSPCHRRGAHDMRCTCKDYVAPVGNPEQPAPPAAGSAVDR